MARQQILLLRLALAALSLAALGALSLTAILVPAVAKPKTAASNALASAAEHANATKPAASAVEAAPETPDPEEAAPKVAASWPPAEIAAAKARCAAILKKISAVAIEEAPIKEGACGAPAPIQLISIGKRPQISISPPAILTCEMAEALSIWVENELQPLAKQHLGSEIIKIETMSSYSCRNAYGRAKNKLSEHGVANALDIRGFVTATAKTAYVLEDWGTPHREILANIAAAKAAAEREAATKAALAAQVAAQNVAKTKPAAPAVATNSNPGITRSTIAEGIAKFALPIPGAKATDAAATGFAITEPNKLGGPKLVAPPASGKQVTLKVQEPIVTAAQKSEFLHAAHNAACQIFGTTLGPEVNAEHRNHFHVDMAARKTTKICD